MGRCSGGSVGFSIAARASDDCSLYSLLAISEYSHLGMTPGIFRSLLRRGKNVAGKKRAGGTTIAECLSVLRRVGVFALGVRETSTRELYQVLPDKSTAAIIFLQKKTVGHFVALLDSGRLSVESVSAHPRCLFGVDFPHLIVIERDRPWKEYEDGGRIAILVCRSYPALLRVKKTLRLSHESSCRRRPN